MANRRLASEFQRLSKEPPPGIIARPQNAESLLTWTFTLLGPEGFYEDGIFKGVMKFKPTYPLLPPEVSFTGVIPTHPNVYPNGDICMSILHAGEDFTRYESTEERWSPAQSISSILLSLRSLLADPYPDSPANVEAAKLLRERPEEFRRVVRREVEVSLGLKLEAPAAGGAGRGQG